MTANIAERFLEAEKYFYDGKLKEAADLCKHILDQDPNFAHAYYLMGALFKSTGNFDNAVKFSDLAIKLNPRDAAFHLQRGHSLILLGRREEAKASLLAAVELDPRNPMAHLLLGNILTKEQQFDEAIRHLNACIALNDMPEAHEHMGLCLQLKGDADGAEQSFKKVLAMRPDSASACANLARVLLDKGNKEEAEKYFAEAVRHNPADAESLLVLAKFAEMQGNAQAAMDLAQRAIQAKPSFAKGKLYLAAQYVTHAAYPQAEAMYRQVLEQEPENMHALQGHAKILMQLGRREEAVRQIEKVLARHPDDEVMRYFHAAAKGETLDTAPQSYVASLFDEYADRFDHHLQNQLGYNTPSKIAAGLKQVMEQNGLAGKKLSLLDLGCGTGLGAEVLQDITSTRVGVDLSAKMIEKANQKHLYDETYVADIVEFMQQTDDTFDLVAIVDVLVYIGNLEPVFQAVRGCLNPGGLCALSVEGGDDAPPYALRPSTRYAHARSYLEMLAVASGFTVEYMEATPIREENGQPLIGYIAVLRKPL